MDSLALQSVFKQEKREINHTSIPNPYLRHVIIYRAQIDTCRGKNPR